MHRRNFLGSLGAIAALSSCKTTSQPIQKTYQNGQSYWPVCLDTATLSKDLDLETKVELAAEAGFDAIEPWDKELKAHEEAGKSLKDLGKKIQDLGMFVPSVIGMWGALAPNKESFKKGIPQHRERLQMVSAIGAKHIQVIPNFEYKDTLNHHEAAWAYSQVCHMAKDYNIDPGIIFLNFVKGLEQMADAIHIALLSQEEKAQIIPDTFHMFMTETTPVGLSKLQPEMITIFQFADAVKGLKPNNLRNQDKYRVLPGDGQIDLVSYLKPLKEIDYKGCISLELYNPEYRKRDPKAFLAEAIMKTNKVLSKV